MVLKISLYIALYLIQGIPTQVTDNLTEYSRSIINNDEYAENSWAYISTVNSLCNNAKSHVDLLQALSVSEFEESNVDSLCIKYARPDSAYHQLYKKSGNFKLLVAYLSFESDSSQRNTVIKNALVDDQRLSEKQKQLLVDLQKGSQFNSITLPFETAPFVHNSLIRSPHYRYQYSDRYMERALKNWISVLNNDTTVSELESGLQLANIITISYRLNLYFNIVNNYNKLISNNSFPFTGYRSQLITAIYYTLYATGRFSSALELTRNHISPLALYLNDKTLIDQSQLRLAENLLALGKFQESNEIYFELLNDPETQISQELLFTNISVNFEELGEKNKYLQYLTMALEEIEKKTNNAGSEEIGEALYKDKLTIYYNLIVYYNKRNDLQTSLGYYELASTLAESKDDKEELASIDLVFCNYYRKQGEFGKAFEKCNEAEQIVTDSEDYATYVDILQEKAEIFKQVDSLGRAQEYYELVRSRALEASNQNTYVESLIDLAEIAIERKNLNRVKVLLDEIDSYSDTNLEFEILVEKTTVKAQYLEYLGQFRDALLVLDDVPNQVMQRIKNSNDSQSGFRIIREQYVDLFNTYISLLIQTGQIESGIHALDEIKTINDVALFNSPLVKAKKLDEKTLNREQELSAEIERLRRQYLTVNQSSKIGIQTRIAQLSAQREEILSSVRTSDINKLPAFWTIQRSLRPDVNLLHFTEIGDYLYISSLTREDLNIRIVNGEETGLFDLINKNADNLSAGNTNLTDLYELSELLGLSDTNDQFKKLIIIPDNHLYRIPIDILPVESPNTSDSYGSTHYLIEDFDIEYYTSLNEYMYNQRGSSEEYQDDVSIFAISDFRDFQNTDLPSLPYTEIEADWIQLVMTNASSISLYNGKNATKEAFKDEIARSKIVHVATHSEVSEEDPLFSTIYLYEQDGSTPLAESNEALYAYELFNTPLNTELIVLNSCSSGSGEVMQGTGIMGITRALRYAGARSMALNLWSVNDKKAAEFAQHFYRHLDEGLSKSKALRLAKIELLESGNADPHYWGAYMMVGNPSPVTSSASRSMAFFGFFGILLMGTGYLVRKRAA